MTVAAAFLASILFGVIFDVPRKALAAAGVAGTVAWVGADVLQRLGMNALGAVFLATLVSSCYGEMMARFTRNPASIFVVPAIVPLVPGAGAYFTMFHFVKGEFTLGLAKGMETLFMAGAIAAGVALVSLIFRFIKGRSK
ncbi:MAG: threonine/serine exporter family protein [Clostridia bacterium]|nr:threonine/serine exporter family protein [Bacillota bacterium]MDA8213272.1 threonine/serine exporter family protein [Clostridia bacterium]